jgi:hypothetical protein
MATTITTLATRARRHLNETTASFWSDAELVDLAVMGIEDLWKAVIDVYQDYFITIDETNVSQTANSETLTGTPTDCFRIKSIEPRTLSANVNLIYRPLDFSHPEFLQARAEEAGEAQSIVVFYDLISSGAPTGTPVIRVAPKLSTAVLLRLVYIPTVSSSLTGASSNPIPGHSDNAVIAWIVAYARAKEREDRSPDPEWIAVYGNEKANLTKVITPRQEDEPDYAEGLFELWW